MCSTCGCGENENIKITVLDKSDRHTHLHRHEQEHNHSHLKEIDINQNILYKNNLIAERNRGFFEAKNILCINLVSSPGAGKTSILIKTIEHFKDKIKFFVVEGDQQSILDAERIQNTKTPVVQINTGSGCHLDASMINNALKKFELKEKSILFIENVGNLVCPALFDIGEKYRIIISSVTEGYDKPLKYPYMFSSSTLCIINKIDLLPYVDFNIDTFIKYARQINNNLEFIPLSCKTSKNINKWYDWLLNNLK